MGWIDKYKCDHEFRIGEQVNYYAPPNADHNFRELLCTKCGYRTEVQENHVITFLASRDKKYTPIATQETTKVSEKDKPDVFKEIYEGNPQIPDSAINYVDDEPYVNTDYATTIVEQAILNNSSLARSLHYSLSTYVSLDDLCEILDFIDKL